MPDQIADTRAEKEKRPDHREFIASWDTKAPGVAFTPVKDKCTRQQNDDREQACIEETMPGSKEIVDREMIVCPSVSKESTYQPATYADESPVKAGTIGNLPLLGKIFGGCRKSLGYHGVQLLLRLHRNLHFDLIPSRVL
jgi:hypothetical protein